MRSRHRHGALAADAADAIAVPAMVLAGELRARAEEPLLERAFGDEYRAYRRRTRRFIPGIY